MQRQLVGLADRNLVWLIGILASANAAARAVQGLIDGRVDHLWLWGVTAVAMVALAMAIEIVKTWRME